MEPFNHFSGKTGPYGCALAVITFITGAWVGFLIWAGVHIVHWLMTK